MASNAHLAQIHIAKKQLAMDDDTYRAMLKEIAGVESAKNLSVPKALAVLAHLKRRGFKVTSAKAGSSRPLDQEETSKKIRALWLFLHDLGGVKNPSEAALGAYVKRITGVEALQWINHRQAETLIESLKKWAMRFLPAAVTKLQQEIDAVGCTEEVKIEMARLLSLTSRGAFDPMHAVWEFMTDHLNHSKKKS
ncbi:regulatory protein GemA [Iodobacter sp. LRB]|uniref:gp16 family protein n=1 Tax=unclassified Iodobacter TaxID=235634 RepID=UPI000C105D88|nr:regulatory protein GemA [Iodobacter sp. BJB302]PHV01501.1 GemA protein [Iodobacter sp. BJB302]